MEQQQQVPQQQQFPKFPTEVIALPSEGRFYAEGSPLSSGNIELYYPTAKSEDILTSRNLITKGIVVDKFLESLIVDKRINMDELLTGDKNTIIIASRILAYGKDYSATVECPSCNQKQDIVIDLSALGTKEIDNSNIAPGTTAFNFVLPHAKSSVQFKLLTQGDEKAIDAEVKSMKKLTKSQGDSDVSLRLRYAIVSIDDNSDRVFIKKFVDNMLSLDSLALRNEIRRVNPDVDMMFPFECEACSYNERMTLPLGVSFFWPANNR